MNSDIKNKAWAKNLPSKDLDIHEGNLKEFFELIFERQEIWHKRFILKQPRPWTKDPILRDYKFTNVYRELDRSSQYLINNIIINKEGLQLRQIIFKMIIYRIFNKPDAFESGLVQLPDYGNKNSYQRFYEQVVNYRETVDNPFHTAYMQSMAFLPKDMQREAEKKIESGELKGKLKDYAICQYVVPLVKDFASSIAKKVLAKSYENPEEFMQEILKMPTVGRFIAHEYYIDICYLAKYHNKYKFQFDENSFTNVGPGASLGLYFIFPSLDGAEQIEGIYRLQKMAKKELAKIGDFKYIKFDKTEGKYKIIKSEISLHQIEMMLCEYSKLKKMQFKDGKQRSKFVVNTKHMKNV